MKANIHPAYRPVQVICSCGNSFDTAMVFDSSILRIEVCANCHPFYIGKNQSTKAKGRVEKFNQKYGLESAKST